MFSMKSAKVSISFADSDTVRRGPRSYVFEAADVVRVVRPRRGQRPDFHPREKRLLLGAPDPRSADGLAAGF